eukprot:comp18657_c0_seq1/m.20299 comp18657_c0_seq1/g.20299  ORF comp18657_c0_seq1/g.20299 comp18657_c0_seq1/m.20299 type:complete len:297 (-) comp18657_c0_seq1:181-1071(-)
MTKKKHSVEAHPENAKLFEAPNVTEPESNENYMAQYTLTETQQKMLEQFRKNIHEDATLTEKHKKFSTDACLCRYLRAREWDLKLAEGLLRATLKWRDEYGVESINPHSFGNEFETGKILVHGRDKQGRPILWMRPRFQNTKNYAEQTRGTVYMIERCVRSMEAHRGVEKLLLVIDFKDYSMMNAPPMSQSKEILTILMDHFPERLGDAVVVDAPLLFSMTYKALSPFLPPETKKKVHFLSGSAAEGHHKHKVLSAMIDMDIVPTEYGGTHPHNYDFEHYWAPEYARWDSEHQSAA